MGTETLNSELQVKPSQLAAILAKCITAKEPVLIAGAPGIGKSDIVEQAARLADAELLVSHPVTSDPTDYKGLPALDIANHCAHFLPFGDLNRLIHADRLTACQPSRISSPIYHFCCCLGIQGNSSTVCLSSLVVLCWRPCSSR
jgi:hypothetical protein